jgi:hypothetical protein
MDRRSSADIFLFEGFRFHRGDRELFRLGTAGNCSAVSIGSRALVMDRSSAGLGDGGVQQIGANCRSGMESEEQNKQRRHQRSAADTGQAYDKAHAESRQGIGQHDEFKRAHGMNS